MFTYHYTRPASMVPEGTAVRYHFAIAPVPEDAPQYADGYRFSSHTIAALPAENPADVLLRIVDEYDSSDAVNSFLLNGATAWLDKSTRVGLVNSISIEKAAGRDTSTLWFNGQQLSIPCDVALQLLSSIELYALACYNITAAHKAEITRLGHVFREAQIKYSSLLCPDESSEPASQSEMQSALDAHRSSLQAILSYDFTTGYPKKLEL